MLYPLPLILRFVTPAMENALDVEPAADTVMFPVKSMVVSLTRFAAKVVSSSVLMYVVVARLATERGGSGRLPGLPGPHPPWNFGGITSWWAGRYTRAEGQDLWVLARRSTMHSDEAGVLRGTDGATLRARQEWLVPLCLEHGFRLSDRLHIHLFGDTRGT